MLKISLSAGHGLYTPGKRTPDGMHEWEFNSAIVKYMMQGLALYQNIAVLRLDDPTGKVDIPLIDRSNRSTAWGANVHIDIHANANGSTWDEANGIETFVYQGHEIESVTLANKVQRNLVQYTGLNNRGVKFGDLHMIREPRAKAKILVEAGFMTNKKEAELLKSDNYRRLVANCIVQVLVQVYDLKRKEVEKVEPKEQATSFPLAQAWVKVKGISDGTNPKEPVTREQLWSMLYRMNGGKGK